MPTGTHTLLLVDDDVPLRTALGNALKETGYLVETADNGADGVAKALKLHPSLVLMDYQMPGLDGLQAIQKIREDEWGAKVPIIFATRVYDVTVMNTILQLGVRDYLLKDDMSLNSIKAQIERYVPLDNKAAEK